MLRELSRKERTSKISALATSREAQECLMYRDYYQGDHFVIKNIAKSDYGQNHVYEIETRSGYPVYDDYAEEEKMLVKSNWCQPVIDTIADYTRGINEEVVVETKIPELEDIWKDNDIDTLTHELSYDAGITGKSFLRIRRKEEKGPIEILIIPREMVYQDINPLTDEVESTIYFFAVSKQKAKEIFPELDIRGDEQGEVYYAEEWFSERVDKFLDGIHINPDKYINPYKFIPFVEVKANVHAISDISDVISLNDQLNVTLTFINEILKYQAFPMLGPKGNYTSDFPALSQQSLKDIEVSPRNIMPIPMERITSGGVDESVSRHIEQLEKDISIVSGVPIKLLAAELDGNMSGVALQRMMSNVVKQAEVRRNYITTAYKQVSDMVLQLLGKTDEVEIIWPEIIKIDLKDKLDEALKKQTLGISKETILSELGYDYAEENSKVQEEFDNSIEKRIINEQQSLQPSPSRKSSQGNKLR